MTHGHRKANGTTYYYQVAVVNAHGESARSEERTATPAVLEVSVVANPNSGSAPLTVSFTAAASGGRPPYQFHWIFGDGGESDAQNPVHTYRDAGRFIATATVTDTDARSVTAQVTTVVEANALVSVLPWASFAVAAVGIVLVVYVWRRSRRSRKTPPAYP